MKASDTFTMIVARSNTARGRCIFSRDMISHYLENMQKRLAVIPFTDHYYRHPTDPTGMLSSLVVIVQTHYLCAVLAGRCYRGDFLPSKAFASLTKKVY